ncbi:MAG: copper amine oxidase N-terminal domain-containing protein [Dethiobacter sp.]
MTTRIISAPTIVAGRTLLPLRYAALAVGVSADDILWDATRRTVTLLRGDRVVQLRIGDRTMTVNGVVIPLEVPATIRAGRTVLPIRAVALALRAQVDWNETARTITVIAQ